MLRGAIVGLGNVAIHGHLPGWLRRPDAQIVAMTDVDPARRAQAAARLPAARWYDSPGTLMTQEPLDFVDICTSPASHAELVQRALRSGLHVLCEKPLVTSFTELEAVQRAAVVAGRVLHTVNNWRYAPIILRAGEIIRDGVIGEVRRVVWQTLRTKPAATSDESRGNWRVDPAIAGGGVLTDHGWHVFYVLRWWIGDEPMTISAALETRRHTQLTVEDTATLCITFPHATADVLLTWAAGERRTWAEITGTRGTLRLEDATLVLIPNDRPHEESRWLCPPALSEGSHHEEWFHRVADDFLGAVGGSRVSNGNLAEAAACVTLEAVARRSSQLGEPVALPAPVGSRSGSI